MQKTYSWCIGVAVLILMLTPGFSMGQEINILNDSAEFFSTIQNFNVQRIHFDGLRQGDLLDEQYTQYHRTFFRGMPDSPMIVTSINPTPGYPISPPNFVKIAAPQNNEPSALGVAFLEPAPFFAFTAIGIDDSVRVFLIVLDIEGNQIDIQQLQSPPADSGFDPGTGPFVGVVTSDLSPQIGGFRISLVQSNNYRHIGVDDIYVPGPGNEEGLRIFTSFEEFNTEYQSFSHNITFDELTEFTRLPSNIYQETHGITIIAQPDMPVVRTLVNGGAGIPASTPNLAMFSSPSLDQIATLQINFDFPMPFFGFYITGLDYTRDTQETLIVLDSDGNNWIAYDLDYHQGGNPLKPGTGIFVGIGTEFMYPKIGGFRIVQVKTTNQYALGIDNIILPDNPPIPIDFYHHIDPFDTAIAHLPTQTIDFDDLETGGPRLNEQYKESHGVVFSGSPLNPSIREAASGWKPTSLPNLAMFSSSEIDVPGIIEAQFLNPVSFFSCPIMGLDSTLTATIDILNPQGKTITSKVLEPVLPGVGSDHALFMGVVVHDLSPIIGGFRITHLKSTIQLSMAIDDLLFFGSAKIDDTKIELVEELFDIPSDFNQTSVLLMNLSGWSLPGGLQKNARFRLATSLLQTPGMIALSEHETLINATDMEDQRSVILSLRDDGAVNVFARLRSALIHINGQPLINPTFSIIGMKYNRFSKIRLLLSVNGKDSNGGEYDLFYLTSISGPFEGNDISDFLFY